jgi:hypothetical protein
MSQAQVISIRTLEDFRAALAEFAVDARDALCAVDAEIRRTETWLAEQQKIWQREIRKRQEEVQRAKNELTARKYQNRDGRGLGSTEQEKALKKALARLEEAETKLANCRRWAPLLHHAVHEYQGPARMLAGVLDTDVVRALALLENKLAALDAYLKVATPQSGDVPPDGQQQGAESLPTDRPADEEPAPVSVAESDDEAEQRK